MSFVFFLEQLAEMHIERKAQQRILNANIFQTVLAERKWATLQSASLLLEMAGSQGGAKVKLALERRKDLGLPRGFITIDDLRGDKRDIQGINWIDLTGRTAAQGRSTRLQSYLNLEYGSRDEVWDAKARFEEWHRGVASIPDSANFVKFRRYDFRHFRDRETYIFKPAHRNQVAVGAGGDVFYKSPKGDEVFWTNFELSDAQARKVLELPNNDGEGNQEDNVQITAIAAKHGLLVAGAKYGEYAIRSTECNITEPMAELRQYIENSKSSIAGRRRGVNHVEIVKPYSSDVPQAILSSSDDCLYTVDCMTGDIVGQGKWYGDLADNGAAWENTCTSQSPSRRLRAIVGTHGHVLITTTDGGNVLEDLTGHFDAITSCAWSENGIHLATGGHDKLVKIWDARMWKNRDGTGRPLTTIAFKLSRVAGLEFSPLGSGRRCLMIREEADVITFLDARTFKEKQTIEVLGQLTGGGWSEDGQRVMVGVQDDLVGGMLTLERCGWGQGDEYSHEDRALRGPFANASHAVRVQRPDNDNILADLSAWVLDSASAETIQRELSGENTTSGELYDLFKDLDHAGLMMELCSLITEGNRLFSRTSAFSNPTRREILADQADTGTTLYHLLLTLSPSQGCATSSAMQRPSGPGGYQVFKYPPLFGWRYPVYEGQCQHCGERFASEWENDRHECLVYRSWVERKEAVQDRCLALYRELYADMYADEEVVSVEEKRMRSETHYRRKAARAGDFSGLL